MPQIEYSGGTLHSHQQARVGKGPETAPSTVDSGGVLTPLLSITVVGVRIQLVYSKLYPSARYPVRRLAAIRASIGALAST